MVSYMIVMVCVRECLANSAYLPVSSECFPNLFSSLTCCPSVVKKSKHPQCSTKQSVLTSVLFLYAYLFCLCLSIVMLSRLTGCQGRWCVTTTSSPILCMFFNYREILYICTDRNTYSWSDHSGHGSEFQQILKLHLCYWKLQTSA